MVDNRNRGINKEKEIIESRIEVRSKEREKKIMTEKHWESVGKYDKKAKNGKKKNKWINREKHCKKQRKIS